MVELYFRLGFLSGVYLLGGGFLFLLFCCCCCYVIYFELSSYSYLGLLDYCGMVVGMVVYMVILGWLFYFML